MEKYILILYNDELFRVYNCDEIKNILATSKFNDGVFEYKHTNKFKILINIALNIPDIIALKIWSDLYENIIFIKSDDITDLTYIVYKLYPMYKHNRLDCFSYKCGNNVILFGTKLFVHLNEYDIYVENIMSMFHLINNLTNKKISIKRFKCDTNQNDNLKYKLSNQFDFNPINCDPNLDLCFDNDEFILQLYLLYYELVLPYELIVIIFGYC